MLTYNQIISDINNNFDIKIGNNRRGLGMVNHDVPVSITQGEFNYIYNFIKDNNLQRGFEVATAFGISALAAALAFKETNGALITMDSYVEEQYNNCIEYQSNNKIYANADGYKLVQFLRKFYGLQWNLIPTIGYSPRDIKERLNSAFSEDEKLDYVFIDALHTNEALILDIEGIKPYLANKFALFIHDIHCFSEQTKNHIENVIGGKIVRLMPNDETNYGLSLINKL